MEKEDDKITPQNLKVGETYKAINLRIINTRFGPKVVANFEGMEGNLLSK